MAFQLHLSAQHLGATQLEEILHLPQATPQEQASCTFAQAWLQGQQEFQVHTSGSTGTPKPIVVSRGRMQASAGLTLQALGIEKGDAALLCINANYIGGKMMIVRAVAGELPLWVLDPVADPILQLPDGVQPLFTALVPLQLQAILAHRHSLAILNKMKAVIVGGAPITPALEEAAQVVQAPLYSTYGMTETVSHIALRRLNGPHRQDYFQALPGMQLGVDERGCLRIEGPVVETPLQTNDVVALLGEGRFRWLGRADHILNSGGVKVQPEQVEVAAATILSGVGINRRLIAAGLPDERLGQKVVLLLEGSPLPEEVEQELNKKLAQNLPRYWAPKEILYRHRFVESENGKIKRIESLQQNE